MEVTSKGNRYVVNNPAPIDDVCPTSEMFPAGVAGDVCTKKIMNAVSAKNTAAKVTAMGTSERRRIGRSSSSTLRSMITKTTSTMMAPA
jgi:hypothetical protein